MQKWNSSAQHPRAALLACASALALAPALSAQSIRSVVPAVADPGDTIAIYGTDLDQVAAVTFNATVNGGLNGHWFMNVAPLNQSAHELRVKVPQVHVFAGPGAPFGPGQLAGTVVVGLGTHPDQFGHFGWLESTFGAVSTQGSGESAPAGYAPRIGFALFSGPPKAGNANFKARVDGLPLTGVVRLGVGVPASAPYLPLHGGELRIDPALPFFVVPPEPSALPFSGSASAALPVPASAAGIVVALQWFSLDPLSGQAAISDALVATL